MGAPTDRDVFHCTTGRPLYVDLEGSKSASFAVNEVWLVPSFHG